MEGEQSLLLFRRAFRSRLFEDRPQVGQFGEREQMLRREHGRVEPHILHRPGENLATTAAPANHEGHLRADARAQLVGFHLQFPRDSVHMNLHSARLARAIVSHRHMLPLAGLGRAIGGHHSQCVARPLAHEMYGDFVLLGK